MKIKEIENNLSKMLKKTRYEHVLRVRDKAIELAKLYNQDSVKIELAALLHDCAKNNEEMYLDKYKKEFEELRDLRGKNPDNKAIVKSLDDTIKYLIEGEREISITSVNVRNYLLKGV